VHHIFSLKLPTIRDEIYTSLMQSGQNPEKKPKEIKEQFQFDDIHETQFLAKDGHDNFGELKAHAKDGGRGNEGAQKAKSEAKKKVKEEADDSDFDADALAEEISSRWRNLKRGGGV